MWGRTAPGGCATSKAFTNEETPDEPIVVPPRPPLPAGVPNYVTARGLELLRCELAELEAERARLGTATSDEAERTRRLALNAGRLADLSRRVASARLVDPRLQPQDEVRFGATVSLRTQNGEIRRYRIVGVDEAAPAEGRIAFLAPLAGAILGLRVGDAATLQTASGEQVLEVDAITYEP